MPAIHDHVLMALLLLAQPAYSAIKGKKELRAMRDPAVKRQAYRTTMIMEWAFAAAIVAVWIFMARSWEELGLGLPIGWGLAVAAVISVAVLVLAHLQLQHARRDPRFRAKLHEQVGDLDGLIPRSDDMGLMRALAITAGICEELAYRGYLLWYLSAWFDTWLAALIAGVAFAAGHLYQGPRQALWIAAFGLATVLLYLVAGSLWLPMLMHALVDLNQIELLRLAQDEPGLDGLPADLPLEPGT